MTVAGLVRQSGSLALALYLPAALPNAVQAQVVVPDDVRDCPGCRVRLTEGRVLGATAESALLDGSGLYSWRAPDGTLWIHSETARDQIQVLAPGGRSVREFRAFGEGPGEFSSVESMACSKDGGTLWIFDGGAGRFARVTDAGEVTTLPPVGIPVEEFVVLSDSLILATGRLRTPEDLGLDAVLIDPRSGQRIAAIGQAAKVYNALIDRHRGRVPARLPDGRVALGHTREYVIDIVDPGSLAREQWVRDAPWFPPLRDPRASPTPVLAYVGALLEGFLVTAILVPEDDYADLLAGHQTRMEDSVRMWDSIVEIIDVSTRSVVHRERRDDLVVGAICPTGELIAQGYTESGFPVLTPITVTVTLERR